jgi:long-chain acyl-CoA synthetase
MTATEPARTTDVVSWPAWLPRSLDYPLRPVGSILRAAVRRWGDREAFLHHEVPLTYTELGRRATAVANGLAARGIGRGDVVAVHLPNCRQYPAVYYGVLMAGATFSPTNPLLPPAELAAQLADAGARAIVTWEQVLPVVRAALSATQVQSVVVTGAAHVRDFDARLEGLADGEIDLADLLGEDSTDRHLDADVDPVADLAHLAYTGGTTGVSKGVELPHRNVVTNVLQSACWTSGSLPELDAEGDVTVRQVGPEEEYRTKLGEARIINLTPWFHAMGAIGYLNGMVMSGTTVVIHDRFDPAKYVEDAVRYRCRSSSGCARSCPTSPSARATASPR